MPQTIVAEDQAVLPGLDGRKMSKSYNNTIPLWLPEKQLRKHIMKIKTNMLEPGETKDPEDSFVFDIYKAFATKQQTASFLNLRNFSKNWNFICYFFKVLTVMQFSIKQKENIKQGVRYNKTTYKG